MFSMLPIATILGLALTASAAPTAPSEPRGASISGLSNDVLKQHLEAREMVWMNFKGEDGAIFEVDAPFLQIELQHDLYYNQQQKKAVSAQITKSDVKDIELKDLVCYVFGKKMALVEIPIVSTGEVDLRVNGSATEIVGVGCGTVLGLTGSSGVLGRDTDEADIEKRCTKNYFAKTWACIFTLGIYCAACPT